MLCVQKRVHARDLKRVAPYISKPSLAKEARRLRTAFERLKPTQRKKVTDYLLECASEPCRWLVHEYMACVLTQ
jgi:hypothetical protein